METGTVPEPKVLMRALRERLGMKQQQVADRSGGRLGRLDVVKLENGQNQGSSDRARAGLAEAYGLEQADVAAYLDGGIGLDELLQRRERAASELRIPRALLHAFVTRAGRPRSRQPFDEQAIVRVAGAYSQEPAGGWGKALEQAQEDLRRERASDASRAAHARKRPPAAAPSKPVRASARKRAASR